MNKAFIGILCAPLLVHASCGGHARNLGSANAGAAAGDSAAGSGGTDEDAAGAGPAVVSDGGESGSASIGMAGEAGAQSQSGRCDPLKKFAPPMLVAGANSLEDKPQRRLSSDGLKMYWWRKQVLVSATRSSVDSPFGLATKDEELAEAATFLAMSQEISTPTLTADKLALYAHVGGQTVNHLYVSSRLSTGAIFGKPVAISELSQPAANPFVSANGRELYFDAMGDLFVASKSGPMFDAALALRLVNSAEVEREPMVSSDALTLYFSSRRTDGAPKGMEDIWVSKRGSTDKEFGPPVVAEELNTGFGDFPVWVSSDDCEIFITHYNQDSKGFDVLTSRRPR